MTEGPVTKVLVDSCIWLDVAEDHRQIPVLDALFDMLDVVEFELLVPEIVIAEFDRNKATIIDRAKQSMSTHFKRVRGAVTQFGDDGKDGILAELDELNRRISMKGEAAVESVERIGKILREGTVIPTTDAVVFRAAHRALAKLAPFHRAKNSMADAILMEIYVDQLAAPTVEGEDFVFVTRNHTDFADPEDNRKPHPDFASHFDGVRSRYMTSLVDVIEAIDNELIAEYRLERDWDMEPRSLGEIRAAEHLLYRQVWYNRHQNLRISIETGETKVMSEADYSRAPYKPNEILDSVWLMARNAAKNAEGEIGLELLGPWDDFEWGMLNGKLSALRWAMGDDWDMLDT